MAAVIMGLAALITTIAMAGVMVTAMDMVMQLNTPATTSNAI